MLNLNTLVLKLIFICGLFLCTQVHADAATKIADSWLGLPSSKLLLQWPVDDGLNTFEVPQKNLTGYTWTQYSAAYTETYQVADGAAQGARGELIPLRRTESIDHPARLMCEFTFYADESGLIASYEFRGDSCSSFARKWGKPKP